MRATHTNKIKRFQNLHYCFTCEYDFNNPGTACPVTNTTYHTPKIPHDKAHIHANQVESMVAQQKSLPDETGAGVGWILADSISKAQFMMQRQK